MKSADCAKASQRKYSSNRDRYPLREWAAKTVLHHNVRQLAPYSHQNSSLKIQRTRLEEEHHRLNTCQRVKCRSTSTCKSRAPFLHLGNPFSEHGVQKASSHDPMVLTLPSVPTWSALNHKPSSVLWLATAVSGRLACS